MDQAHEPQSRESLESRYVLIARVAIGGMATLHYARRASDGHAVAIKIIHEHLGADPHLRKTFLYEADLAKRLEHPNMVRVLESGEDDKHGVYMVIEYVEGGTLGDVMKALARDGARLAPPVVARLLLDLCYALHAAHSLMGEDGAPLHLVHRDVSPQNLLVGLDGKARLVDFGIAKSDDRYTRTRQGQLKGKLAYMSPERLAKSAPIDRRVDVFAAGILLWEALLTRRLFKADNEMQVVDLVLNPKVPLPSAFDPELAPYDAVVSKALAKDPDARYATASDLADGILAAAENTGGVADRESCAAAVAELLAEEVERRNAKIGDGKTLTRLKAPPAIEPPEQDTVLEADALEDDALEDDAFDHLTDEGFDDLDADTLDRLPPQEPYPTGGEPALPPVATASERSPGASRTLPLVVFGAVVCLAVGAILGVGITRLGDDDEPVPPAPPASPAAASPHDVALAACREALMDVDPAEALAQAQAALAQRPGSVHATACEASARNLQGQESIFARGQNHLDDGELAQAFNEFQRLPSSSPYRQGPHGRVVTRATRGHANVLLREARAALDEDPLEAARLARFVLDIDGLIESQSAEARSILGDTEPMATPDDTDGDPDPVDVGLNFEGQAIECSMRGDNQCVIRTLEGHARTPRALGLLIEAYRAQSRQSAAMRHMRTYVDRWPNTPQGRAYRQILMAEGQR